MSNFTQEMLFSLYERHLLNLTELSKVAADYEIGLEINIDKDGTITIASRDWFTTDENKSAVKIFEIVKGNNRVEESCKTFVYDNK